MEEDVWNKKMTQDVVKMYQLTIPVLRATFLGGCPSEVLLGMSSPSSSGLARLAGTRGELVVFDCFEAMDLVCFSFKSAVGSEEGAIRLNLF